MKQRLIGAIVLVSLAVIFIPIILEGPDDEWTPRSHSLPDKPQLDYRADVDLVLPPPTPAAEQQIPGEIAVKDAVAVTAQPVADPGKSVEVPAPPSEPVKVEPKPEPKPSVKSPMLAAPVEKTLKGWFVQVGSFGQEMNARGLQERLAASGFKAQLQKVEIGNKHAYRVLVGPSVSRSEAEKLAASLKSGQQLKGMVVEYPG